tara:strand:+ start:882 stop:1748 length:867 start_codon:yes stop_codon:yes gene_type:complete
MLLSMTGFGKTNTIFNEKKISIEIRTLNSKSIELKTKIPLEYRGIETQIRKMLGAKLYRGKIDLSIYSESTKGSHQNILDIERVKNYYDELREINKSLGETSTDYLSMILKMPDIYTPQEQVVSEEELQTVMSLLESACDLTIKFREQEGETIELDFTNYISNIKSRIKEVERFENERIENIKKRIHSGLSSIKASNIDENRMEQELLFYIEKLDISEEKSRLNNHLVYFLKTMKESNNGKKLGFISQEIGREINTLGSKSNHTQMQQIVVEMKDFLEKIKEQVLNTL